MQFCLPLMKGCQSETFSVPVLNVKIALWKGLGFSLWICIPSSEQFKYFAWQRHENWIATKLLESSGRVQALLAHLVIAYPQERSFPPLQSFNLGEVQKAPWKVFAPVSLLMSKWEFWVEAQFSHGSQIPWAKQWVQNSPHCFLGFRPRSATKVECL